MTMFQPAVPLEPIFTDEVIVDSVLLAACQIAYKVTAAFAVYEVFWSWFVPVRYVAVPVAEVAQPKNI